MLSGGVGSLHGSDMAVTAMKIRRVLVPLIRIFHDAEFSQLLHTMELLGFSFKASCKYTGTSSKEMKFTLNHLFFVKKKAGHRSTLVLVGIKPN